VSSGRRPIRLGESPHHYESGPLDPTHHRSGEHIMWTKPEAEIVAVTMEVTAYVATL
jgi:coenzyme PQQ precursor peptide PqqA